MVHLENEHALTLYERTQLQNAFDAMRRKIEEKVPSIAEVEERRIALERETEEKDRENANLQEQLRDALRKLAKTNV